MKGTQSGLLSERRDALPYADPLLFPFPPYDPSVLFCFFLFLRVARPPATVQQKLKKEWEAQNKLYSKAQAKAKK